ncbi:MAG: aldo/keto reductase [Planctomycetaceae bacterium]|nr:aldo/keto reductase [Planctomycetales bacterium]MCB9925042.1 aldo/keto reductase [Planctomycetaceae bacterium]
MIRKTLGRTGLEVTQLGYGSMGLRGPRTWGVRVVSDAAADEFLNLVLDSGINFIDTSPDYGISEQRIGQYIGARRSEYILATKCGCSYTQHEQHLEIDHIWEADVVRRNLETSLRRLQTDYLDILQFHGGDAETLQRAGLIDLLLDFRAQGMIQFLGVSSSLPHLSGMIDLGVFDTFQIPYSCLAPQHEALINQAAKTGAGIIIRGGIAQGGPEAEIQRPALNDVWNKANLDELLPAGMRRAELILRYTLSHPHCHTTIVGTCNPEHLAENLAAAQKGSLPQELRFQIDERIAAIEG